MHCPFIPVPWTLLSLLVRQVQGQGQRPEFSYQVTLMPCGSPCQVAEEPDLE